MAIYHNSSYFVAGFHGSIGSTVPEPPEPDTLLRRAAQEGEPRARHRPEAASAERLERGSPRSLVGDFRGLHGIRLRNSGNYRWNGIIMGLQWN